MPPASSAARRRVRDGRRAAFVPRPGPRDVPWPRRRVAMTCAWPSGRGPPGPDFSSPRACRADEALQPVDGVVAAPGIPGPRRWRGAAAGWCSMPSTTISASAPPQPGDRLGPRRAVHHQLRHQAVVVRRHRVAGVERAIHAHAEPARRVVGVHPAGRGREGLRILGGDAALDGVAVRSGSRPARSPASRRRRRGSAPSPGRCRRPSR